jgi:hypothetical protein
MYAIVLMLGVMTHHQYLKTMLVIAEAVKYRKWEASQNVHADIFVTLSGMLRAWIRLYLWLNRLLGERPLQAPAVSLRSIPLLPDYPLKLRDE